jgi:hypothetical protein
VRSRNPECQNNILLRNGGQRAFFRTRLGVRSRTSPTLQSSFCDKQLMSRASHIDCVFPGYPVEFRTKRLGGPDIADAALVAV